MKNRTFLLALLVPALALSSCDDGVEGVERIAVGTYQLDREAVARTSPPGKTPDEAQSMMAATNLNLVLEADGTFVLDGNWLGRNQDLSGSWILEGERLVLTPVQRGGASVDHPDAMEGTFKDGVARLQVTDEEPEMIFRRRQSRDG